MGNGKAQRRRARNAEQANISLHKAALRKRGATAHIPLPSAPTKEDYQDRMPASLRKMLSLKAAVEQPAKRRKLQDGQAAPTTGELHRHQQQQQQQEQHWAEPADATDMHSQQLQGKGSKHTAEETAQAAGQEKQQLAPTWQQPKKLKQKKKDYLNAKKMKKKHKGKPQLGSEEPDVPRHSQPAFGEVVHAPPELALKSRHWAASMKQAPDGGGGSSSKHGSRAPASPALAAGQSKSSRGAPVSGGGGANKGKQQQQQQQRRRWQQQSQDPELLGVRDRVIEGYRAGRPMARERHATLQNLKILMRQSLSDGQS